MQTITGSSSQAEKRKRGKLLGKNEIRLQYSGFIIFTAQILSIVTGLAFTLLLTRSMSTDQYGIWTNIFDYTGYFLLFSGLVPFWATRFVAREQKGTIKTSTLANLSLGLISVVIYFPAIALISQAIGTTVYLPIYLIARLVHFEHVCGFETLRLPTRS